MNPDQQDLEDQMELGEEAPFRAEQPPSPQLVNLLEIFNVQNYYDLAQLLRTPVNVEPNVPEDMATQQSLELQAEEHPPLQQHPDAFLQSMLQFVQDFQEDVERVLVGEMIRNNSENIAAEGNTCQHLEFASPVGQWVQNEGNFDKNWLQQGPLNAVSQQQQRAQNIKCLLTDALSLVQEAEQLEPTPETREICEQIEAKLQKLNERLENTEEDD